MSKTNDGCYICGNLFPTMHEHHIRPQATGPSEQTVQLCPSCHQTVHTTALAMLRGDHVATDRNIRAVGQVAVDPRQARRRLADLAAEAARWLVKKREGQLDEHEHTTKVMISLGLREKAALRAWSLDHGFKNQAEGAVAAILRTLRQDGYLNS